MYPQMGGGKNVDRGRSRTRRKNCVRLTKKGLLMKNNQKCVYPKDGRKCPLVGGAYRAPSFLVGGYEPPGKKEP